RCRTAQLVSAMTGIAFPCTPLLGTAPAAGMVAEVLDLGLGRVEDFGRHADRVRGRIVMVRHEYPFASAHVHRRAKLSLAQRMGAVGSLIAHPEEGVGAVSGSSGRNGGAGIPALGIGLEAADAFHRSPDGPLPTARMVIDGDDYPARTRMLIADLPGRGPDWVVVSAHIDGHPHGESAMDNASGVAVALGLGRLLAPHVSECPRGLRICLFSAEEWGLIGSRIWLERMDEAARRSMVINLNLDSVGGASALTALPSGFERLDAWVKDTAARAGLPIATHVPLMANSDHANFAAHGIPAVRLLAGFNAPDSNLRLVLTAADTRDKVQPKELAGVEGHDDAGMADVEGDRWEGVEPSGGARLDRWLRAGPQLTLRLSGSPAASSSCCCWWRRRAPTAAPASAQSFRASHAVALGTRP